MSWFGGREVVRMSPSTLVLDMDETLVHSFNDTHFLNRIGVFGKNYDKFYPKGKPPLCYSLSGNNEYGPIWGLYRPHLWEFLETVDKMFDNVVVWSAGAETYVLEIIRDMYSHIPHVKPPKLIQTRGHCRHHSGYPHKPVDDVRAFSELKNLDMVVDTRRTLIVDDKEYTFRDNPSNGILIPAFSPPERNPTVEQLLDRSDERLLELLAWFREVKIWNVPNFTVLRKENIFS